MYVMQDEVTALKAENARMQRGSHGVFQGDNQRGKEQ